MIGYNKGAQSNDACTNNLKNVHKIMDDMITKHKLVKYIDLIKGIPRAESYEKLRESILCNFATPEVLQTAYLVNI
jgi:hypothetical protein